MIPVSRVAAFTLVLVTAGSAMAGDIRAFSAEQLDEMDIESLLGIEIEAGTLTGSTWKGAPAALTIIPAEEIAVSPARNLADLLETYVPGFQAPNHVGPKIGLRGIVSDRNNKTLVLVNGKEVNDRVSAATTADLMTWDLTDIERVEVLRGPGSVVYGPGAINGVINIITKTSRSARLARVGTSYLSGYGSWGAYANYAHSGPKVSLFAHTSFRSTDGYPRVRIYEINERTGEHGYLQNPGLLSGDLQGTAQVKSQLTLTLLDEWRADLRFVRSGAPSVLAPAGTIQRIGTDGEALSETAPNRIVAYDYALASLENNHSFTDGFRLKTHASWMRIGLQDHLPGQVPSRGPDEGAVGWEKDSGNIASDYLQQDLFLRADAIYELSESYRFHLGAAYTYERVRPYTKGRVYLQYRNDKTPDGTYLLDEYAAGFDSHIGSVFGEANLAFHPLATLVLSARTDKNQWADLALSPRAALVSTLTDQHIVKFIAQRSVRMPLTEELMRAKAIEQFGENEYITSYELIYTAIPLPSLIANVSAFYGDSELRTWRSRPGATDPTDGFVGPTGRLKLFNLEVDGSYKVSKLTLGASHAWTRLIDFEAAEGVGKQGITHADYGIDGLSSYGNSIANWAENVSKLYVTASLPYDVTLHVDGRYYWGFDWAAEVVPMYDRKYEAAGGDSKWEELRADLLDKGLGDGELVLNFSLGWKVPMSEAEGTIFLWGNNLLGARRYTYSSGVKGPYPAKLHWTEEPRAFGLRFEVAL